MYAVLSTSQKSVATTALFVGLSTSAAIGMATMMTGAAATF
jgi:hypothetical protein